MLSNSILFIRRIRLLWLQSYSKGSNPYKEISYGVICLYASIMFTFKYLGKKNFYKKNHISPYSVFDSEEIKFEGTE